MTKERADQLEVQYSVLWRAAMLTIKRLQSGQTNDGLRALIGAIDALPEPRK